MLKKIDRRAYFDESINFRYEKLKTNVFCRMTISSVICSFMYPFTNFSVPLLDNNLFNTYYVLCARTSCSNKEKPPSVGARQTNYPVV